MRDKYIMSGVCGYGVGLNEMNKKHKINDVYHHRTKSIMAQKKHFLSQ